MIFLSTQKDSTESKRKNQDIASMVIDEESMSDVVNDEVTKNTILNALPLKSEAGRFFNTALEKLTNKEVLSLDP